MSSEQRQYSLDPVTFEVIKNAEHAFTAKVEGDTWHHVGKLANGTTIDETWERVKPAENGKAP